MATLNVGRICVKTAGREAGRYACVLKKVDENFVLITGPRSLTGVKRRRCNVEHLEPTPHSVSVKADDTDKAVIQAYQKAGLLTKLGLKKPSPEVVKEAAKKAEKPKKEEKKKPEKEEKAKKKEGMKIKIKVPTLRRGKPKEKAKKPEKKAKPKKVAKKKKPVKKKRAKKK